MMRKVAVLTLIALTMTAATKRNYMDQYAQLPAASPAPPAVRATFLGVSTILFDDGETAVITDAFFTRPGRTALLLGKLSPNPAIIEKTLARAGIKKLAAVLVSHSHYDHCLDSAEVAKRTGAVIVGSDSTANIARGAGFPEERIMVAGDESRFSFGRFQITFVRSEHAPSAAMHVAGGSIRKPLKLPARAIHFQEGGTYSILIKHNDQKVLVQSSAGFVKGALKRHRADVVFLGVGLLGKQSERYRDTFWSEVVQSVGARRVIPVHWDDFTRPLETPLPLAPRPFDDIEKAMTFVADAARRDGVDLKVAPVWTVVDPFAGF